MCPKSLKNCHFHFILPRKKLVSQDYFRASEQLCVYKNQSGQWKNKSIRVVYFLVESINRLIDLLHFLFLEPYTVIVLVVSWLFNCILIDLVKFAGSPYADDLLCFQHLGYVWPVRKRPYYVYSQSIQILSPEWQMFYNPNFSFSKHHIFLPKSKRSL